VNTATRINRNIKLRRSLAADHVGFKGFGINASLI
jgi:hypothetical protein